MKVLDYLKDFWDIPGDERESRILALMKEHPEDKEALQANLLMHYAHSKNTEDQLLELADKVIAEAKDEEVLEEAYHHSARVLGAKGELEEAIRRYSVLHKKYPDVFEYLHEPLELFYNKHKLDDALSWAEKLGALEDVHDKYSGNEYMGIIHFRKKRYEQALEAFRVCEELEPDNTGALHNMGACYGEMGDQDKSREYFEKVLAIDPKDPEAMFCMGQSYQYDKDQYRAMHWYTEALKIKPDMPNVFNNIGALAHEHDSDYKAAVEAMEQAIEAAEDPLTQEMALVYQNLGKLHKQMLNHDQAEECKKKWYECLGLLDLYNMGGGDDDSGWEEDY